MMNTRNIKLALILVVLTMVSVGLSFWERSAASNIDHDLFAIENIDPIDRIVITTPNHTLDGRAFAGGFMINDHFPMDGSLLNLLASVLQQVRVQRPLSAAENQLVWSHLKANGSHVQMYAGDQMLASYWTGGDELKQNSYFATENGQVYLVYLPGYSNYISGLFELPLKSWRSRKIFLNTWRSLLSFNYQDYSQPENDFSITYKDPFFSVSGVQRLDSNRVMGYLQNVVDLSAAALVDTTVQAMPWLEISTTDIDPLKNQSLLIYGDLSQPTLLGKTSDQYFEFQTSSLRGVIKNAEYFKKE